MRVQCDKYRLTFKATDDGSEHLCSVLNDLLVAKLLMDWCYDTCGGEDIGPYEVGEGEFTVDVWLLGLRCGVSGECLESRAVEVVEPYVDCSFLEALFPGGDHVDCGEGTGAVAGGSCEGSQDATGDSVGWGAGPS